MPSVMQSVLGIVTFISLFVLLSENRSKISFKKVTIGLLLQLGLGVLFLHTPGSVEAFSLINEILISLQEATLSGTQFLFGYLAGGPTPFENKSPENNMIIAIQILPLIIVIGGISAVLFHWNILPRTIKLFSIVIGKAFGISGSLSFGASASLFLGTIETPLVIKPNLKDLSRSELFALISVSMATVAGTVMAIYASLLGDILEDPVALLVTASFMSVPAALLLSQVWIPDPATDKIAEKKVEYISPYESAGSALMEGSLEASRAVFHIIVAIIVLITLVNAANAGLSYLSADLTIQTIAGKILRPVMWLTGISWQDAELAGNLMGTKIALNEFVSFLELAQLPENALSVHSKTILSYCMCGFANLGSVGIIIGGLGALIPERKQEVSELTLKSLLVGNAATLMTGCVANLLT